MAKVLFLTQDLSENGAYPPWQFASALAARGHDTVLAGPRSRGLWSPLARELEGAAVLTGRWAGLPQATQATRLAVGMDAVYAFKAMPTSLGVGLRVRRSLGIPAIVHLDDWDAGFLVNLDLARRVWRGARGIMNPRADIWLRWTERRVRDADGVTVSTRALQRRFGGSIVRQGVDTDRFSPVAYPKEEARARLGIAPGRPMVLFLGTPRLHKGLVALAEQKELRKCLWFVGASEEALWDAGVSQAALGGVEIVGPVPFADAAWYLAACDVFVAPQESTPFAEHQLPAKLLHAMALGCPIVTTDVGDAPELLGGDPPAGVVVAPGDRLGLASAVQRLLMDREGAEGMGAEARRRAKAELGWDAMGAGVERVLREVGVHV